MKLPAAALVLALAAAAALGYLVGGPYGRDATRRALEIQELPIGTLGKEIEIEQPELPAGAVRNVILMIGDCMGVAQIQAARLAAFGPQDDEATDDEVRVQPAHSDVS